MLAEECVGDVNPAEGVPAVIGPPDRCPACDGARARGTGAA